MKVLLLVIKHQKANLNSYYEGISSYADVDVRRLDTDEQSNLARYFKQHVNTRAYDRIIFMLRFKREIRQLAFIRTVPNLVILEHDVWTNYYPGAKYYGKFSRHYRDLPWARVLVSSHQLSLKLQNEDHNAIFIPKPYDSTFLKNLHKERDIDIAFVGSTDNSVYTQRNTLLTSLSKRVGLRAITTKPGNDYLNSLNRIKIFVGADIGFCEYMTKNFEAMACGCLLFTWSQGAEENQAIGFIDLKNVVLYNSVDEFVEKLALINSDPDRAQRIATAGQRLVESRHNHLHVGKLVIDAIIAPLRPMPQPSKLDRLKYLFRR